jgi:hypothetical protein
MMNRGIGGSNASSHGSNYDFITRTELKANSYRYIQELSEKGEQSADLRSTELKLIGEFAKALKAYVRPLGKKKYK